MKNIQVGLSPCPNDTFIFDALINRRINTGDFRFEPVFADIEELNKMAQHTKLPVTKVSTAAYAGVSSSYVILDSGSALGSGAGPLLVSKDINLNMADRELTVAIPGKYTTANLLLSVFYPFIKNKTEVLFSEIEDQVIEEKVNAGLLIHEGRFTYQSKGLFKQIDLGEVWENEMHIPLPLGCICADRDIHEDDRKMISQLIRQSIAFAFRNPDESKSFIKKHSQEMDDHVIASHIKLYVNKYSLDLGAEGRNAIEVFLNKGMAAHLLPKVSQPIFNPN